MILNNTNFEDPKLSDDYKHSSLAAPRQHYEEVKADTSLGVYSYPLSCDKQLRILEHVLWMWALGETVGLDLGVSRKDAFLASNAIYIFFPRRKLCPVLSKTGIVWDLWEGLREGRASAHL